MQRLSSCEHSSNVYVIFETMIATNHYSYENIAQSSLRRGREPCLANLVHMD